MCGVGSAVWRRAAPGCAVRRRVRRVCRVATRRAVWRAVWHAVGHGGTLWWAGKALRNALAGPVLWDYGSPHVHHFGTTSEFTEPVKCLFNAASGIHRQHHARCDVPLRLYLQPPSI
eukprot:gene9769-biopygen2855